jgi:hypothetical protein
MKIRRILFLCLGMTLLCSCTSEQPERNTTTRFRQRKKSTEFPKLKDYSLHLSLISSRREFYAGEDRAYMIFSLKNTGLKPLVIREWHTLEAANVNLYYRPVDSKETDWKLSPGVPEGTRNLENRSALILNPGNNQAMIQVPVRFLKELKNPARQKHPYFLKAVLNLRSVSVESAPVEIFIK